MGGRGSASMRNNVSFERLEGFDVALFNKLPKKLQVKNIVDIDKYKDSDGVNYNAVIVWEDGFQRSIHEYGWKDFKYYLELVLTKDRTIEL